MNSFHATQVVAWQCGLWGYKTCKRRVPAIMEELIPAEIKEGMVEPKSTSRTQKDWFVASKLDKPEVLKANARDLAFFLGRNDSDERIGWTNFIVVSGT